jgi:heat shock protein HslJ
MKRVFIALPLVILLTNCNTQRNTTSNDSMGANTPGTSGTMGVDMSTSGNTTGTSVGTPGSTTPSGTETTGTSGSTTSGTTPQATTGTMGGTTPGHNTTGTSAGVNGNATGTTANWNAGTNTNAGLNQSNSSSMRPGTVGTTYDPNNYMQNPEKYKTPAQLGAAGGWTYNTDWRMNTNFKPEAMGQWQMVATPEVASLWRRDTSRPETYAAYWTPEAVSARHMEEMAINARRADSIAMLSGTGSGDLGTSSSAGMNATTRGDMNMNYNKNNKATNRVSGSMNGTTGTTISGSVDNTMDDNNKPTDVNPNNNVNGSMNGTTGAPVQGSTDGTTTGSMSGNASGTMNASGNMSGSMNANANMNASGINNSNSGIDNTTDVYTAVNGNKYMMPRLSLYLDNGTFTGYTGCNNITGKVTVDGNRLTFENAMPATNFGCTGGFDQDGFMDRLRRADSYEVSGEQLHIKQGSEILFVLAKSGDQYSQSGDMK